MQTLKPIIPVVAWVIPAVTAPVPVPIPTPDPVTTPNPSLTVAAIADRMPFPWDAPYTGTVDGWDATQFKTGSGKAVFKVTLTKDAPGIWLRPHSGTDTTADPKTAGTGKVLHAPIQVSGPAKAGVVSVSAIVPHGLEWFLADFDTDPNMSAPVRLPQLFGVGFNGSGCGTSHAWRYAQQAYSSHASQNPKDFLTPNPFGVVCGVEVGQGDGNWHLPGEAGSGIDSFYAATITDYLVKVTGGIVSFSPYAENGGSTGQWQPNDPKAHTFAYLKAALSHTSKTHWFVWILGPNDKFSFSGDHTASMMARLIPAIRKAGNNPDMVFSIAASPLWDGGQDGFLDGQRANLAVEKLFPGTVAMAYDFDAGGFWSENGHADQWGRSRYAISQGRVVAGLWGEARGGIKLRRGPQIVSAKRDGKMIEALVQHDGALNLTVEGWQEGPAAPKMLRLDTSTVTIPPEALASFPDIFPAGLNYADVVTATNLAPKARMQVASVQIVNVSPGVSKLMIALVTDPGDQSKVLDLWWGMGCVDGSSFGKIVGAPPGQWMLAVKDDAADRDGTPYGRDLQRSLFAVPVIPVAVTPTTINIDQPQNVIVGQRKRIGGTGSGVPASTVQVSLGGAAPITPAELIVRNDNTWSGIVTMPATSGPVTLALPNGPVVTAIVNNPRDTLPASWAAQAVAFYRADVGVFADKAGTIPAAKMAPVMCWRDQLGGFGDLTTLGNDPDTGPLLDFNKRDWGGAKVSNFNDPRALGTCLDFEEVAAVGGGGRVLGLRNPAITNTMQGDVTIILVIDGNPTGNFAGFFQLANTTANWGFDQTKQPGITGAGSGSPFLGRGGGPSVSPKLVLGPDYWIFRFNATTGLARLRNRSGEVQATFPTAALAPFNSLMIGGATWNNVLMECWARISGMYFLQGEPSDDVVNNDTWNYLSAEFIR